MNPILQIYLTLKGRFRLHCLFILQYTVEVVVVDNAADNDLLYCNSDPH